jgi:hypothetical protein
MAYVAGISIAAADGFENGKGWLALPLAGPWIALATRHSTPCSDYWLSCDEKPSVALVFDGCIQLAAATLVTVAFAAPRKWAIRQEAPVVMIRPLVTSQTYGAALGAVF